MAVFPEANLFLSLTLNILYNFFYVSIVDLEQANVRWVLSVLDKLSPKEKE